MGYEFLSGLTIEKLNKEQFNSIQELEEYAMYLVEDDEASQIIIQDEEPQNPEENAIWIDTSDEVEEVAQDDSAITQILNRIYPIGRIYTTSSSTNPANELGIGTWELVDKEFAPKYGAITTSMFTKGSCSLRGDYNNYFLNGHNIMFRICLNADVALSDSNFTLGNLKLSEFGLSQNSLYYGSYGLVGMSDGGDAVVYYQLNADGSIVSDDILNINDTHTLSTGEYFYINYLATVPHTYMSDSFCNKFHWKRVA